MNDYEVRTYQWIVSLYHMGMSQAPCLIADPSDVFLKMQPFKTLGRKTERKNQ